jgi:hypothetical protein
VTLQYRSLGLGVLARAETAKRPDEISKLKGSLFASTRKKTGTGHLLLLRTAHEHANFKEPPRCVGPTLTREFGGGERERATTLSGKRAAGGMSEDNDRCFSTLVLAAFSTGVFQHHCITPH